MGKFLLWQLHHQFKDGHTELCAQRELTSYEDMEKFIEDTKASHPLPEGAQYLICNENSEDFVMGPCESMDKPGGGE